MRRSDATPGWCEPSAGTAPTCAANVDNGTPEPTLGRSAVGTDTTFLPPIIEAVAPS
jgi:hypothetical protein